MSRTVKVIIVDKDRNTVVADMDQWLFDRLNIKSENIKKHKSQSALTKEITEFIKIFGND